MAELKTQVNDAPVAGYIAAIADAERRADCERLVTLMQTASGVPPRMWGAAIVGFGSYRYAGASGRSGEWMLIGFSSRKADLTLYIMPGFEGRESLMAQLGKHKTGKSCLYIKRLADVDEGVLRQLIQDGVDRMGADRVS